MKVFILFIGDYEQRSIHSVHSSRVDAERVFALLSKDYREREEPDIEERELDPLLCRECGHIEEFHSEFPDTWKHSFKGLDRT